MAFVVTNGTNTKFRGWNETGPCWVEDLQDAVQYARREDAEKVHAEDEDAWHVREVGQLADKALYRPMLIEETWHLARYDKHKVDALVDFSGLGLGREQEQIAVTICAAAMNRSHVDTSALRAYFETIMATMVERSFADVIPSDPAVDVLHLLLEFCTANATQWRLGAGDGHHPIWRMVSETLGGRTPITEGSRWLFIQPENRLTLAQIEIAKAAAAEQ